jgi:plastocyanin
MRVNKKIFGCFFVVVVAWMVSASVSYAATLTGKVSFEGTAPEPKPINFGAEKQCAMMHGDKMPVDESLIVNANKTVKWALVYVKDVKGEFKTPETPAEMDQNGCTFSPHAIAVMAGQKIVFKNDDPVLHNVRANSKVNKAFNIAQPIQGMKTTKSFAQEEIGIQMRCDVHFWMSSYIHVLSHPFFAITGDDGSFTIKDLPAGTYTVEVWHEKLGMQTAQITVTGDETKISDFTLKLS